MDLQRHPARHDLEGLPVSPAGGEVVGGDHLEDINLVERLKNPRRKLGTPAKTDAIVLHQLPQPPHPPPPPPHPLPPPPHEAPPKPAPQLDAPASRLRKCCTNGDAKFGTAVNPNSAANQSNSREP